MRIGLVLWMVMRLKGGVERVGAGLAHRLVEQGHSVTVFFQEHPESLPQPAFPFPPEVEMVALPLQQGRRDLDPARRLLTERGLDVLAILMDRERLLWFPGLLRDSGIPLLLSNHEDPLERTREWNAYERHACLEAADLVHVLLPKHVEAYPRHLHPRIRIVPNPVGIAPDPSTRPAGQGRPTVLGVGRFDEGIKQFSFLIKAFARVAKDFPDWELRLCGDGSARRDYERLSRDLGIADRLTITGMVDDVRPHYAAADIVCVPSRTEAFGLAVTEGQSFGLPVVGFAACPGVNALVKHEETGLLAEDMTPESLAEKLAALMRDELLRRALGENARTASAAYAPERIYADWENMLLEAVQHKGATRLQHFTMEGGAPIKDAEERACREALLEVLERPHPFDRRELLRRHKETLRRGEASPFGERDIRKFKRGNKKFGFAPRFGSWAWLKAKLGRS